MIKNVFLFPNGAVACTDEHGKQVMEWQLNAFTQYLKVLRAAGVIADDTRVESHNSVKTVVDWIGPKPS